jgi:signal transduction histidine kinase
LRSRHRKIGRVTVDALTDETLAGRSDALMPGGQAGGTGPDADVGRAEAGAAPRRTFSGRALKNLLMPGGQAGGTGPDAHVGRAEAGAAPRSTFSSRALKNLRVRPRLLLLVAVPTIAAVALGGFHIVSSVQNEQLYQRVRQLAILGQDDTNLVQALEDERDHTVYYIALGADGGRASVLSASSKARAAMTSSQLGVQYAATDQAISEVRGLAQQLGSSYPKQTQHQARAVLAALDSLPRLRADAANTNMPVLTVVTRYAQMVEDLLALDNGVTLITGDPVLAQAVSTLGLVSQIKEEASQQRAILAAALLQGAFGPHELTALQNAVSVQQINLQALDSTASPSQLQLWNADVAASFGNQASADELLAISLATKAGGSGSLGSDPTTADDWYNTMTNTIEYQMGRVQQQLVTSVTARVMVLRKNAITGAVVDAVVVLLILMLAMLFTMVIGQSMVRPLRKLVTGALEVAGMRLPEMVRRFSETDGEGVPLEVQPIDVDSSDEIGEVARAFDQVHREALRLAANEAALRGNVNSIFVNLSRRSQSLVERQIRLIDDLEQGEQDAERLSNLFQMDHLATRMRRNSENLLVLAGHEIPRRWNQPVALVDVLRAAVSEIEQYERVSINVQPGIAVRGQAVNDGVHLVAELVENATSFSSAETPVTVSGHPLNSGGVLLDITDQGIGMAAEEMAHANWRLDNLPAVDVSVSRMMGLFVVARLAARHGIRVRLRPAPTGGLTTLVWLPDETVTHDAVGFSPALRRSDRNGPGVPGPAARQRTRGDL